MDVSRSCDRIWLLLVFVTAASCQQNVSVVVGQDVLLPCTYGPSDKPLSADVFWRWGDDVKVYDIVQNVQHPQNQALRFRDRVSSFPELYRAGNFSLLLRNVTQNDKGAYSCHVLPENFLQNAQFTVQLNVIGEEKKTTGGGAAGNRIGNKSGSIGVRLNHLSLLVFLLLGQSVLCEN